MTVQNDTPALKMISLAKIKRNPQNPRGAEWKEDDPQFESLRTSIRKFGILVPIVVTAQGDDFLLIDGERRFEAAISIQMKHLVPAYIIEGDYDPARVRSMMFHIHMNRLQWDAAEQCRASEDFYAELVKEFGEDRAAISKAYRAETGMDGRTARNRLQFLRWPNTIKQRIYEASTSAYWYVVEIEDKIIEPAQRNYPEYFERVPVDDVRKFLFQKFDQGLVSAAVEVRAASPITKSKFTDSADKEKALKILDELVTEPSYTFHAAREQFGEAFPGIDDPTLPSPVSMLNSLKKTANILVRYDASEFDSGARPQSQRVDLDEVESVLRELKHAVEGMLEDLGDK